MTPAEQKAYYAANAAKGKKFEKEQDDRLMKPIRDAGETAIKGMSEGRMDQMGNSYKKGGKVGSASKRADGCAVRGKTKGTMVMCGGGYMGKGKK
jgi:hypothetical protein